MRSMTLHVWAIYSWSALSSQLITKALSRNFQMTVERTIPHGADMMRSDPMRSDPMVGDPLRGDPLHADGARRDLPSAWRPDVATRCARGDPKHGDPMRGDPQRYAPCGTRHGGGRISKHMSADRNVHTTQCAGC